MLTEVYGGTAMALEILGNEFYLVRADGDRVRLPTPPPVASSPVDAETLRR